MDALFNCSIKMSTKANLAPSALKELGQRLQHKLNLMERHVVFVFGDRCLDTFLNFSIGLQGILTTDTGEIEYGENGTAGIASGTLFGGTADCERSRRSETEGGTATKTYKQE